MFLLIDFLTYTWTGVFLTSFIIFFYYMDYKQFIISMVLFLLFSNNYYLFAILLIMFLIEKILTKYVNYNLIYRISLFTFFYLVINNINISYFINLLLVILIHLLKYNNTGDFIGNRKIFK